MKCFKQYLITFALCLVAVSSVRRPPPKRSCIPAREEEPRFPLDFRMQDLPYLRVPSSRFCAEQELQPAQHYVVLPWWYHYCQEMRERRAKKQGNTIQNLHLYMDVLNRVNRAKKQMANAP